MQTTEGSNFLWKTMPKKHTVCYFLHAFVSVKNALECAALRAVSRFVFDCAAGVRGAVPCL